MRLRICLLLIMLLRQMGAKTAIENDLFDLVRHSAPSPPRQLFPEEAVSALTDPRISTARCPTREDYCFHLCTNPALY